MKKKLTYYIIFIILSYVLIGCGCRHDWQEATCTTCKECLKCHETQGEPLGHEFGPYKTISESTCSVHGEQIRTCQRCGKEDKEYLPLTQHTRSEWITIREPSIDRDGEDVIKCVDCGMVLQTMSRKISAEAAKSDYIEKCTPFTYENYVRNPEAVKGSYCKSYGEVIQVLFREDGVTADLRVTIIDGVKTDGWFDNVWVVYTKNKKDDNVLEGDYITFYGTPDGLYTYDTVSGTQVTLPIVYAKYVDIGVNNVFVEKPEEKAKDKPQKSNGMKTTANVLCLDKSNIKLTYLGIQIPESEFRQGEIDLVFEIENNTDTDLNIMVYKMSINDYMMKDSGVAYINAGTKGKLKVGVENTSLEEVNISSIDKISAVLWDLHLKEIGRFTINTNDE